MADDLSVGTINWRIKANAKEAKDALDDLSSSVGNLNKLFGLFKVSVFLKSLKSIGETIGKVTTKQMEYIQTLNVFNKTMGKFTDEASTFRDNMEARLGMDPQNIMDSMSAFQRLTETFGITQDRAYLMSKNMTQLASDMTAYGYTFENAMQKLKSGLSGELEPMRAMGVALDKNTLQQTLYANGIDRTYDSLTRAQKTELLYYQIMTQTSKMQGELGRTMTSPANMARIMKQEFTQLGRAIGSIFIPIAMKIIPVVRAVVQILTEAAKRLASFFGFKIGDYTSEYSAGLEDISVGLDDIEDSATSATKAMNKMLMPFDELNNINFSSGSGNGGGIGNIGAGGSLFDILPEYNIFDSIVGNIDKDVERIKAKIESMLPVLKAVGIAFATVFAFKKLAEFVQWISNIKNALSNLGITSGMIKAGFGILFTIGGIIAQYQGTKKLLKGDFSLWAILETLGGTALGTFGIVTILKQFTFNNGLVTLNNTGNQIKFGLGVMLALQSLQVINDGIKNGDIMKMFVGALEGGIAGFSIASSLGAKTGTALKFGVGTTFVLAGVEMALDSQSKQGIEQIGEKIGGYLTSGISAAVTSGNPLIGLTAAAATFAIDYAPDVGGTWEYITGGGLSRDIQILKGTYTEMFKFDENSEYLQDFQKKISDLIDNYKELKQSVIENRDARLLEISETEGYLESLDRIVDENGNVKKGYEELGEYILNEFSEAFGEQYELIDGVIYKNGEVIGSYAEFRDSIDKNIAKMKEEAEQAANISLYEEAYKQRKKLEGELKQAKLEHEQAEIELQKAVEKGMDTNSKEFKELEQHFLETGAASKNLKDELNRNYGEITDYSITAFGTLYDSLEKGNDIQAFYLQNLFTNDLTAWEKIFDTLDDDQKLLMLQMTSTADTWNPKLAQTWQDMANKMPEKFEDAYNEMQKNLDITLSTTTTKISGNTSVPQAANTLASKTVNEFDKKLTLRDKMKQKLQDAGSSITLNTGVLTGPISNLTNSMKSKFDEVDFKIIGKNIVFGVADGINENSKGSKLQNAISNISNAIPKGIKKLLDIKSPSRVMRDEVGKFIPLGIAEGIDMEANSVSKSMQDLANKVRIDQQDFEFYSDMNLASNINGKISTQIAVALSDNTLQNMTNATYEAMSRALIDNNEDYNPQFNVYIGNDKLYSGFGNYKSNESNRYGVRV